MKQFEKILIANRGEIAVRIIRAAQKNGIRSVAVYAADDADSLHVSLANEAILLPGVTLAETYLNQDKIIQTALDLKVEAIHPGYGFLSENAVFAQKVADAGLVFIGPTPENIRLMGEKNRALAYVESLGLPILKSFRGTTTEILKYTSEMDFPVMVKASGGGGGKGMVICNSVEELPPALEKAERQAHSYFGNGELFVEKYLPRARHIEVQLMADNHGKVLHFFERECSVQRRFQKIIEEAPSPSVDEKLREELTSAAVEIARSMSYRNAGTIEFLLDESGKFYFLEMNTRIQVEHPVTEMITNTDLVSLQLQVALGNELSLKQEDIQISGHAIEARLCAEDAGNNFNPSAGKLVLWQIPEMVNLRKETFVERGIIISSNYDSLLAKLIVWGETRTKAIAQMNKVLSQTYISGVHTNLSFLSGLVESVVVQENKIYTRYVDENLDLINSGLQEKRQQLNKHKLVIAYLVFHFKQDENSVKSVWNQIGFWRMMPWVVVYVDDEKYECTISFNPERQIFRINQEEYLTKVVLMNENLLELLINHELKSFCFQEDEKHTKIISGGFAFTLRSNLLRNQVLSMRKNELEQKIFQNLICADLFGKVLKLNTREGDVVRAGQILLTLESMKTEIHVLCQVDARVKKIFVKEGNAVVEKQLLVELEEISLQSQ
ncbi:methylcrotonyl-CoA carboxylase biotin-containing subunit [Aquipluma nitroreducens]|uniref:Methylcrotonyl-CoA carboxylase biotin-containing subunit n=1 Tax=Aquipluma nitroreducens TaxID=2010828 RepID=A0A5K7S833_9BACT|nr:biotin carboxylase N-terminal domain-containing protein [Aquipluma nitroreducens]BBE17690.1 methylcrotonyl-CoA carboxylase biotin-containing subunit [Aquipluma nitroreducens]